MVTETYLKGIVLFFMIVLEQLDQYFLAGLKLEMENKILVHDTNKIPVQRGFSNYPSGTFCDILFMKCRFMTAKKKNTQLGWKGSAENLFYIVTYSTVKVWILVTSHCHVWSLR